MTLTIRVTNLAGNLTSDGTPTGAACDRLNAQIVRAILEDLPGADVRAAVVQRTSGDNPHPLTISGHEDLPHAEQERIERLAQAGAEEGYDRWMAELSLADLDHGPTLEPVTAGGWYEHADGTVGQYRWADGQVLHLDRVAASWGEVTR